MPTAFVSGCFDPIHTGHIEFLRLAAEFGELHVSVGSDRTVRQLKRSGHPRQSERERLFAVRAIRYVHAASIGDGTGVLDCESAVRRLRPDYWIVSDDQDHEAKRCLARSLGLEYRILPRTPPLGCTPRTSTSLVAASLWVPARVDFAGGWLDVPHVCKAVGIEPLVVNMAISPGYISDETLWRPGGGLGGSAACAILRGDDPFGSEAAAGVGWQDPAVLLQTGLCVWAGKDKLEHWSTGSWLAGKLAVLWTGTAHSTPGLLSLQRPYHKIRSAAERAADAVAAQDLGSLATAISMSYGAQLDEGMHPLPEAGMARKYCGAGHGGYAMYLFESDDDRRQWIGQTPGATPIEPHSRMEEGHHHGVIA